MKMKVIEIGSTESEAGNIAVKIRADIITTTVVGDNKQQVTYYLSTQAKTVSVKVDDFVEIDLDLYTIVIRNYEYTDDAGDLQVAPLKWLVPKPVK
jgi:hypothetical protein